MGWERIYNLVMRPSKRKGTGEYIFIHFS
jgi:hypothetical protein